ncbi:MULTISPECIES: glycosyl hydrolase [unclassified Fibrobacter]|uniref:glycosyl hydrolase n=1 Tax=unclassified Fibrobacter TaxID=2634177 RepID=UPI000D6DB628|nr:MULTISPECIES: glycosyl hydrolase [unclassified Fibrobacter]PWJ62781.1 O-glycosyl hydrolase [Fibrobacter sp. UWR4]PZW63728.1 O-glycosyl hydrolase [Fibrobacter sp. UWR1]
MIRKLLPAALAAATMASAAGIAVDPAATQQSIVGFGGGSVYYQGWILGMAEKNQQALFDTAFTGLNLSFLRMGNWLQSDEALANSADSLAADIKIVKAAKERLGDHLKIEMSSWSAPGKLKPSNSVNGKDGASKSDKTLKKATGDAYGAYAYTEFANWWKQSLQAYNAAGIVPDYISLQNEPDMEADYAETLFEPTETNEIAGYKQALNAVYDALQGMANKPKILGPEPLGIGYENFQKYMNKLDDSKLDGYAYHLYHAGSGKDNAGNNYLNPENFRQSMKAIGSTYGNKPIIMTEFCNMLDKTREADMVGLAHIMQAGFTDGKLSGYIAWELFWGGKIGQMIGVCAEGWGGCKADEFYVNPEYHAMRHYSKFVNPGWKVITSAVDDSTLKTVAFTSATGDSISVVVINPTETAIQLDNPVINGMGIVTAVQSKENGFKSKPVSIAACTMLPARSVTTLVYQKGASAAALSTCVDETTDPNYTEPVESPTADIVLVDYSTTTDVSTWSQASNKLGAVSYVATPLDGVTGYASVPLAGCEQADKECGYQSQVLKLSDDVADALSSCAELTITMRSATDGKNAYVNVGAANAGSWLDYQYGRPASGSEWSETTVNLDNEGDNESNSLTFNSDAEGIYIAKIVATGCKSTAIHAPRFFNTNDSRMIAQVFDLNGNMVWTGLKGQAMNADGTLRLNIRQGAYILKTKLGVVKAIKK